MFKGLRISQILVLVLLGIGVVSVFILAQAPAGPVMRFTATLANVSGAPDQIRIDILSWSTDMDRDQFLGAWKLTAPPPAAARGAGAPEGRGGGRGARGGGAAPEAAAGGAPAAANPAEAGAAAAGATPQAAGAGGGRGGRGGGRGAGGGAAAGAAAADAARQTPEKALAAALQGAKTVGYVWSSESAGYSLKYAYRVPQTEGGERIIFLTDRRLGVWNDLWKPTGGAAVNDYDFTLIEVRLNAKGLGEGKTSLTGKVTVDSAANTVGLDGYAGLPVVFKDLKRVAGSQK